MTDLIFSPSTIWTGDNLPIMEGMNDECIDLIYLDPPFNSKVNYAAPIGSPSEGAEFKDTWTLDEVKIEWIQDLMKNSRKLFNIIKSAPTDSDKSYLIYMAKRLIEIKRILKPTGSVYLHCDPTMSHWLKILMDCIFRKSNFMNEIIWHYQAGTGGKKYFKRKHDTIFFYKKGKNTFNRQGKPVQDPERYDQVDENGDNFLWGSNWDKELKRGTKKYYLKDGATCDDVWTWVQEKEMNQLNPQSKEKTYFPTQKPLALLERIIKASSNEGDLVFDPFCGCATALVAAERLKRKWVGIDVSPKAVELVNLRIQNDRENKDSLWRGEDRGEWKGAIERTDIPPKFNRTDKPIQYRKYKSDLFMEQNGVCNLCGTKFFERNLEVDHIVPKADGGTDDRSNLQLLCTQCNREKGRRSMEYMRKLLVKKRILLDLDL